MQATARLQRKKRSERERDPAAEEQPAPNGYGARRGVPLFLTGRLDHTASGELTREVGGEVELHRPLELDATLESAPARTPQAAGRSRRVPDAEFAELPGMSELDLELNLERELEPAPETVAPVTSRPPEPMPPAPPPRGTPAPPAKLDTPAKARPLEAAAQRAGDEAGAAKAQAKDDKAASAQDKEKGSADEGEGAPADAPQKPEAAPAAGPAAAGGRATAGTGRRSQDGEEEESSEETLPAELAAQDEVPLEAPRLDWQPLTPAWLAAQNLPADALPIPAPASGSASATTPPPSAAPGQPKGPGAPAPPAKSPVGGGEQTRRQERDARERAQRSYLDLVRDARHEQESFVGRANRICAAMASAYDARSREVLQGNERDLGAVDAAADQAAGDVELAASFAQMTLESASRKTSRAIEAAGRSAYGLINADDRTAAQRIGAVVTGLVSGHTAAYDSAISALTTASDAALLELNTWRDERATNYSTEDAEYLEGAKNEKRQARIPAWVDPAATELNESVTAKTTEWGTTRDNTVCSLSCSYRGALETERVRVNTEGRASVTTALKKARRTLKDQTRDGVRALGDLRSSYLDQIRTRQRATRSGLLSQARGTLAGLHQEARGALLGVQGAANGAMASFERGPRGLEQTLRQSAPTGAAALRSAAERTPAGLLQTTQRESAQLDTRLQGNLSRLETSVAERITTNGRQSADQLTELNLGLAELNAQATQMLDQSTGGLVEAFGGLAATVSQAASNWSKPLAVRMAGFIAGKQGEAAAALTQVLTGEPPTTAAPPPATPPGTGEAAAPAPDCSHCAAAPAGTGDGAGAAGPRGLTAQADAEIEKANRHADPATFFADRLAEAGSQVESNLAGRATSVARKFEGGWAGTVDEEGAIAVLRGLTPVQGRALDLEVYGEVVGGGTLDSALQHYLEDDPDDYAAASAYLRGDAVEGARLELEASSHWYNDDEARIEATMRALSPDQLQALGAEHGDVVEEIRGVLGGTDQQVFNALAEGNYARADAYRMRDAVNDARRDGNADATHSAIEQFTGAPGEGDWRATQEMSSEDRRRAVVAELGLITSGADLSRESADNLTPERRAELEAAAVTYVTRDIQVLRGGAHGETHVETLSITGANRDLAGALLLHGSNSVEARAARLGVEMQRKGDPPNALNIDRATFDERFTPDNPNATPEERAANERQRVAARRDRARMLLLAAHYAPTEGNGPAPAPADHDAVMRPDFVPNQDQVAAAQSALIGGLRDRFGSDTLGGDLAAGLLSEERPSARTASLAMQHAMYSRSGTNEELLFRFTERMNRDEIAAMRDQFRTDTGRSLDAELGVYGEGSFGEVSGDDRLRMERALRGVARTDQERLEASAYALHQQRQETGSFGAWLAEGTLADQVMRNTERRIERLAGGPIGFSQRGELTTALPNFTAQGRFTGADRDAFTATTGIAQQVAENYSARIDAFADVATTGLAILGAIAAAVITVATGGAAGPLIVAAIATGLASMAANAAIKGGRYGWEQAGIDLGMTAVQALTAGVGAQLGAAAQIASKGATAASAASRSLSTLARLFTGNPVVDQIIVGALTGSIGGLANTAFDERTWEKSGGDAVGALFSGLLKGALSGAATATLTNSIEALGRNGAEIAKRAREIADKGGLLRGAVGLVGRGIGGVGRGIDAAGNASIGGGFLSSAGSMAARGLKSGAIAGLGGMTGRGTEILFDAAAGRYQGDFGDALMEMGQAGLQAAVQGIGEGAGEAVGQRFNTRAMQRAESSIAAERASMKLEALSPEALTAAAADLMFLNQHGANGSDALGRAINLDHIATHGGIEGPTGAGPRVGERAEPTPRPVSDEAAPTRAPAAAEIDLPTVPPPVDIAPTPRPADLPEATPSRIAAHEAGETAAAGGPRPAEAAAEAGGPPVRGGTPGGEGEGGGPPRRPSGGEEESDRLFPNLTDAEIDAAFAGMEAGPLVRIGADQPGADTRPAPASEATLLQRQRAGALNEQADGLMERANGLLNDAIAREADARIADTHNPRRAKALREEASRLLDQAVEIESRANSLRAEAADFASGRRSATADLPGPEDVDTMFAGLQTEETGLVRIPLSDIERNPELLPRLIRSLVEGEGGGRIVFRVESERSRSLVHVDAAGNVTVEGGASIHLNFGSFERAVEFVMQNSRGAARIIRFEVDESWVRAARSAAIPEHETAALAGQQPRIVDVRFGDDQMEIPPGLIGELNRFIVPGSGVVHEIPAPGPRRGGGTPGDDSPLPPPASPDRAPTHAPEPAEPLLAAAKIAGTEMTLASEVVIKNPEAAVAKALPEALSGSLRGMVIAADGDIPRVGETFLLQRADGSIINVKIVVGETENGNIANFPKQPDANGEYVITLSSRAPETTHARALAHELTELRFHELPQHARATDTLRPQPGDIPAGTKLSAHDRGRLAELEILSGRLQRAKSEAPPDPVRIARLQHEAESLVAHLGLAFGKGADARSKLVAGLLTAEGNPALLKTIVDTVADARQNPLLRPRPTTVDDFATLAGQIARAKALGNTELANELLQHARALVRDHVAEGVAGGAPDLVTKTRFILPGGGEETRVEMNASRLLSLETALVKGTPAEQAAVRALIQDVADRELARAQALQADRNAAGLQSQRNTAARDLNKTQDEIRRLSGEIDRDEKRLASVGESPATLRARAKALNEQAAKTRNKDARRKLELEAAMLAGRASDVPVDPVEIERLRTVNNERRASLAALRKTETELGQRLPVLDRLVAAQQDKAAERWAHATRPEGSTAGAAKPPRFEPGSLATKEDLPAARAFAGGRDEGQQELVRQRFGDLPQFQEFGDLLAAYNKKYPENDPVARARREADLLARWSRGQYLDPTTGAMGLLGDLPFVPAPRLKEKVVGKLADKDPVDLLASRRPLDTQDADAVIAHINATRTGGKAAPLSASAEAHLRALLTDSKTAPPPLTVEQSVELSMALVTVRNNLEGQLDKVTGTARDAIIDRLKSVETAITDLREALGVAAGRKAASIIPALQHQGEIFEGHGRDTVDLAFGDSTNGPLIIVECKGRAQRGQGERQAEIESTGEVVRAEQGTREYLLSVSQAMQGRAATKDMGGSIQEGLVNKTPAVRYFIVRQEFNSDGSLGSIKYVEYPMYPATTTTTTSP